MSVNAMTVNRHQGGVALVIMVWFVAAMAILVGSISYQARMDIKLAQLHRATATAEALADGAIQLALAEKRQREGQPDETDSPVFFGRYRLGDTDVIVRVTPVSGLIDLNKATEALLQQLFHYSARLPEAEALALADNVIKWRSSNSGKNNEERGDIPGPGSARVRHGRFEAPEDLLLVEGMNRAIFDNVSNAIYVAQSGQAGVDWRAAPVGVIAMLSEGDMPAAMELVAARLTEASEEAQPPAELDLQFQEAAVDALYQADAVVILAQDRFLRRRWVDDDQAGQDGLPWSYFRTEPVRSLTATEVGIFDLVQSIDDE